MINCSKSGRLYFTTKQAISYYATFLFVFPDTFYKIVFIFVQFYLISDIYFKLNFIISN